MGGVQLMILLLTLLALHTITLMETADLTASYPEVDFGLGIAYPLTMFKNEGCVRLGLYSAADLNSDLSRPDWVSFGAFLSRDIQVNITIGACVGYRLGTPEGWQAGMFLGFDLYPWRRR